MFTGIIEGLGLIESIEEEGTNKRFTLSSPFTSELKVDQSIAHNGVCLTVEKIKNASYEVVAVKETLEKTNLHRLEQGDKMNLERCMKLNDRLDGHLVQGHVDAVATVEKIVEEQGSTVFQFKLLEASKLIVEKGSICINGVSLTAFDVDNMRFSVTIVPYTFKHTNFHQLEQGDQVNIEFDIIGKYIARLNA